VSNVFDAGRLIAAIDQAMTDEDVSELVRKRVIERLAYGHPCSGTFPKCRFIEGPDGAWICRCGEILPAARPWSSSGRAAYPTPSVTVARDR
jgi:hypothetical protein